MKKELMTINQILQGLLLLSALSMAACAKKVSYDSSSSRVGTLVNGKPYALCSQGKDIKSSTGLTLTLRAITNPQGGYYPDTVALALETIPEKFKTENEYLQFWRWKVNTNNEISMDTSAPLSFYIVRKDTNQYISEALTKISWNELQTLIVNYNIPATTLEESFQQLRFIVSTRDVSLVYDVLRTNFYSPDTNVSQFQVDALIPVYDANPNDYQYIPTEKSNTTTAVSRPSILLQMHPFYSQMSQSWSDADYQSQADTLCNKY